MGLQRQPIDLHTGESRLHKERHQRRWRRRHRYQPQWAADLATAQYRHPVPARFDPGNRSPNGAAVPQRYGSAWGWSSNAVRRMAGAVTRSKASGGTGWNETSLARQMPWLLNKRYGLNPRRPPRTWAERSASQTGCKVPWGRRHQSAPAPATAARQPAGRHGAAHPAVGSLARARCPASRSLSVGAPPAASAVSAGTICSCGSAAAPSRRGRCRPGPSRLTERSWRRGGLTCSVCAPSIAAAAWERGCTLGRRGHHRSWSKVANRNYLGGYLHSTNGRAGRRP